MNNRKIIIMTGLLIVAISVPLTLTLVKQQSNKDSHAAAADKLEAEGGTPNNLAQTKTDSNASGGSYVELQNKNMNPTPTIAPNSYFVATTGNDINNGSQNSPWATLQKAINTVPQGSTIYLRTGVYLGADIIGSNLTITAYPGDNPILTPVKSDNSLRPNTIAIKGKWLDATTHIPSKNIEISGLTFEGCFKYSLCTEGIATNRFGAGILTDKADGIRIKNNFIRNNKSYGIRLYESVNIIVENNDISLNETGIEVNKKGSGVIIQNNRLHNNDKLLYKTPKSINPSDDAGAEGLSLFYNDGQIIVRGNEIYDNRAASDDFTEDGGAMDIFGGQGPFLIENNTAYNQDTFLETGQHWNSDPNAVDNVANITFRKNIGWNLRTGIIARAAKNSFFSNNTFYGTGAYKFLNGQLATGQYGWAIHQEQNSNFGGYITGIKITNNITVTAGTAPVYSLYNLPTNAVIDGNLIFNMSGNNLDDAGDKTISAVRTRYAMETNGIQSDPLFMNPFNNDFHLKSNSLAIGKGAY